MGRSTSVSSLLAALAARSHWLTVEWLPKYAPELNDIEVVWHDLKAHHLAQQTFTDVAAFDHAIHTAVQDLSRQRMAVPLAKLQISATNRMAKGHSISRVSELLPWHWHQQDATLAA
jgi:DDE superfamily endonuclease